MLKINSNLGINMSIETQKHNNKIELRSEKVRKIIGEIPSVIVCIGRLVNIIVLVALVLAVSLILYPNSGDESIISHVLELR